MSSGMSTRSCTPKPDIGVAPENHPLSGTARPAVGSEHRNRVYCPAIPPPLARGTETSKREFQSVPLPTENKTQPTTRSSGSRSHSEGPLQITPRPMIIGDVKQEKVEIQSEYQIEVPGTVSSSQDKPLVRFILPKEFDEDTGEQEIRFSQQSLQIQMAPEIVIAPIHPPVSQGTGADQYGQNIMQQNASISSFGSCSMRGSESRSSSRTHSRGSSASVLCAESSRCPTQNIQSENRSEKESSSSNRELSSSSSSSTSSSTTTSSIDTQSDSQSSSDGSANKNHSLQPEIPVFIPQISGLSVSQVQNERRSASVSSKQQQETVPKEEQTSLAVSQEHSSSSQPPLSSHRSCDVSSTSSEQSSSSSSGTDETAHASQSHHDLSLPPFTLPDVEIPQQLADSLHIGKLAKLNFELEQMNSRIETLNSENQNLRDRVIDLQSRLIEAQSKQDAEIVEAIQVAEQSKYQVDALAEEHQYQMSQMELKLREAHQQLAEAQRRAEANVIWPFGQDLDYSNPENQALLQERSKSVQAELESLCSLPDQAMPDRRTHPTLFGLFEYLKRVVTLLNAASQTLAQKDLRIAELEAVQKCTESNLTATMQELRQRPSGSSRTRSESASQSNRIITEQENKGRQNIEENFVPIDDFLRVQREAHSLAEAVKRLTAANRRITDAASVVEVENFVLMRMLSKKTDTLRGKHIQPVDLSPAATKLLNSSSDTSNDMAQYLREREQQCQGGLVTSPTTVSARPIPYSSVPSANSSRIPTVPPATYGSSTMSSSVLRRSALSTGGTMGPTTSSNQFRANGRSEVKTPKPKPDREVNRLVKKLRAQFLENNFVLPLKWGPVGGKSDTWCWMLRERPLNLSAQKDILYVRYGSGSIPFLEFLALHHA